MARARTADASSPANSPSAREIVVDDFTGQPAAAAVDAARLVGLRPAPERVEGDDPDTYGVVVSQEPPAGTGATRGTFVTLYVAAPPQAQTAAVVPEVEPSPVAAQVVAAGAPVTETDAHDASGDEDDLVLESPLAEPTGFDRAAVEEPRAAVRHRRPWSKRAKAAVTTAAAALVLLAITAATHEQQAVPSKLRAAKPTQAVSARATKRARAVRRVSRGSRARIGRPHRTSAPGRARVAAARPHVVRRPRPARTAPVAASPGIPLEAVRPRSTVPARRPASWQPDEFF